VGELTRVLRPIETLSSIRHGATSPLLRTYLENVLSAAMDAFRISTATGFKTVHLFDDDTRSLRLAAYKGNVSDELLKESGEQFIDVPEGVISWVALKRRAVLITDLSMSPFRAVHVPRQSKSVVELAVPMMAGNELLGVFNIESAERLEYPSAVDLVRVVWYAANQAAIAARLSVEADLAVEQADIAQRHASASAELLRICSHSSARTDTIRPLDPVAELASKYLQADCCDIWKFEHTTGEFWGVGADYSDFEPQSSPRKDGFSQFVHKSRAPVWICEVQAVTDFKSLIWSDTERTWCALLGFTHHLLRL
jgi:putative methionine-R-sulfoxide reductase with GAF domain